MSEIDRVQNQSWPHCWCSDSGFTPFGNDYVTCLGCGTIVSLLPPPGSAMGVEDDGADFYGESYGDSHQIALGLPGARERVRLDLSERCSYWMQSLLRYRRPPGRLLEVGCAHGASTKLFSLAGFDATGMEMSPATVDKAKAMFDIDYRVGPIERLDLRDLQIVVSFDVVEHLADPLGTLRKIRKALESSGLLMLQTPSAPETSYEVAIEKNDRFLEHLKPSEHVYLFTKRSMKMLLDRSGFPYVNFERPIYDYDMFLAASDVPLERVADDPQSALQHSGDQRVVRALLDAVEREQYYAAVASERLNVIEDLKRTCDERLALIERLSRELHGTRAP